MFSAAGGWRLLLLIGIVHRPSSWNANKTWSPPYRCAVFRVSSFLTFYSVLIVGEKSAEENVLSQQSSLSEEVGARKFSGPH